ncbi:hypothetical protein, partial [Streptomyces sp. SID13726]|uniref:hypothetical protein n=1 Tax=Streptomyces sp. SID13726 TaxID=2706058 RepID=UPI001940EB4D
KTSFRKWHGEPRARRIRVEDGHDIRMGDPTLDIDLPAESFRRKWNSQRPLQGNNGVGIVYLGSFENFCEASLANLRGEAVSFKLSHLYLPSFAVSVCGALL